MGRGSDNILEPPHPKRPKPKEEAKEVKEVKEEKLWYSPDEITLILEIPEDYINMEGSVVDEKTVRLHHADGPDREIHLSHSLGGAGSSTCDHNAPESMPANSSVPVKITASINSSGMVNLNARIQGTPPGYAVGAMLFQPGSKIREESFYIWTRGPRLLQANLDIKVKIVAKSLKTATQVLYGCRICKRGYPLSAFRDPKGSPTAVYTDAGAVCFWCWHEINDIGGKNLPEDTEDDQDILDKIRDLVEDLRDELGEEAKTAWRQAGDLDEKEKEDLLRKLENLKNDKTKNLFEDTEDDQDILDKIRDLVEDLRDELGEEAKTAWRQAGDLDEKEKEDLLRKLENLKERVRVRAKK